MEKQKYIVIKFNLKSFHHKLFDKILKNFYKKARILNIFIKGAVSLPTKTSRFTVLRSPHVNKTSREQFEVKIYHKLLITMFNFNNEYDKKKAKLFINYIKNSCSGLQVKITYNIVYLNKQQKV